MTGAALRARAVVVFDRFADFVGRGVGVTTGAFAGRTAFTTVFLAATTTTVDRVDAGRVTAGVDGFERVGFGAERSGPVTPLPAAVAAAGRPTSRDAADATGFFAIGSPRPRTGGVPTDDFEEVRRDAERVDGTSGRAEER
ncbi:hypothetical protein tb265_36990 [Gemmatimonadetes bacterium T265]|nr:hypothetical protein tb265_36990 [Gemmatimonadetes bacterium T265]